MIKDILAIEVDMKGFVRNEFGGDGGN